MSRPDWEERAPARRAESQRRIAESKGGISRLCQVIDNRQPFGSQLAMNSESLYKISKLMGNSPEVCRRHHAALLPQLVWIHH
jgi:hypothetical protein